MGVYVKVLVFGVIGFIGQCLVMCLCDSGWVMLVLVGCCVFVVWIDGLVFCQVDIFDVVSLCQVLGDIDVVVNCVVGYGDVIGCGVQLLVEVVLQIFCLCIVYMSFMVVYGNQEGCLNEDSLLDFVVSWYVQVKCEVEEYMKVYVVVGYLLVMLCFGCVYGFGSDMWVEQMVCLVVVGRLGDLGVSGEGWFNLVYVDDVCVVVLLLL